MTDRDATARDLFPGALEMMVLRTLERQPMHGYALVQRIKRSSRDLLQIEEGSLYPALHRLEAQGLITSTWGVSENNRRARFYELTARGRKRASAEVSNWRRLTAALTRVFDPLAE
jgi:PadR family transcriptional regulator, regulatory protein PadR